MYSGGCKGRNKKKANLKNSDNVTYLIMGLESLEGSDYNDSTVFLSDIKVNPVNHNHQ